MQNTKAYLPGSALGPSRKPLERGQFAPASVCAGTSILIHVARGFLGRLIDRRPSPTEPCDLWLASTAAGHATSQGTGGASDPITPQCPERAADAASSCYRLGGGHLV